MAVQLEHLYGYSAAYRRTRSRAATALRIGEEFQPVAVGSVFVETDTGRTIRLARKLAVGTARADRRGSEQLLIEVNSQILEVVSATQRGHEEYLWEEEAPSL